MVMNPGFISGIIFSWKVMNTQNGLEDIKVCLKLKLAALWASLMFLYIYVDYFHLYMPGKIEDIQTGRVFKFDIT